MIDCCVFQGLPGPDGREGIPGLPGSKVTLTFKGFLLTESILETFFLNVLLAFRVFQVKVGLQAMLVHRDFL